MTRKNSATAEITAGRTDIRLERQFAEVGVEVDYFSYTQATSSSRLRRTLQNIDELAKNRATGTPFVRLAA
jgi:hypothetical protein